MAVFYLNAELLISCWCLLNRLKQSLVAQVTDLGVGNLEVDDEGCERGLGQLSGVVDSVTVQHHQLHASS